MTARAVCLAAILATAAAAQTPTFVEILADESQVLVGRTLQLRAVVRDSAGNALPNATVAWTNNQPAAGAVNQSGLFTATGLATVRVTARAGSVTGEAAIQTTPSRIEITPSTAEIEVGAQQRFTATAYDADAKPIPNVTFSWSLLNERQGSTSLGTVNSSGMVSATGEGGMWLWATYNYNETFPGLQQRWVTYAPIVSSAKKAYELRKLYSSLSQTRQNWTLRPRQSMLYSTDDGTLFFNASLGGLANALVSWKDGRYKVVSGGGVPRYGRASTALEFRQHSITRDGQILSYEDTNINGTELNLGTQDGLQPFLNNNVPLGDTEAVSGLFITRNSYTSNGWIIVRANYRLPGETTTYVGLFRGLGDVRELLVSTRDSLAEMPATFTIDSDFGIAADGTAYYSTTSGATRVFYKHDALARQKLIGVGDALAGSKVRSFVGGRTNVPSNWFDEDGTAIVAVALEDNTQHYVSFAPDGKSTTLRVNSQVGILCRHPAQGTLLYANPYNNKGNGAHMWSGADTKLVSLIGTKVWGQTVQEIESGTINKSGEITLLLRGDQTALMATRFADQPVVIFAAGDTITADLPVNLFTLIGGARTGPPHVQAGGNSGSIAEFSAGDWNLTLGIGERLFGNTMWFGGSHGTTYNMRKAPNGDIYFTNNAGIARIVPGGAPELVIPFPLRIDSALTANAPGQLDVNSAGAILFHGSTSAGDNRMFIYQNGQAKQILVLSTTAATASTIAGRIVSSFDSFAFDDTGRVLAQLRFRGLAVPTYAVYDGNTWIMAAIPNETRIGVHTVTGLPNTPRASGSKLFAGLTVESGGAVVAEWQGQSWNLALDVTSVMPNGQVANSIAALDINKQGDVLFQFANGVNSMVVRRDGKLYQVHNFFRPTADGDWLIRINSMDFRDDGTVYFLAVNAFDEVVLYEARPLL